jgi:hypothetical protein
MPGVRNQQRKEMAMTNRVFTDKELEELGALTSDLLNEAIDSGDKEKAKRLAKNMFRESLMMHDMYVDWVTGLMDYIYKNYGENDLYQALREWRMRQPKADVRNTDFKTRAKGLAHALKGHQMPIKVEEDEEKVSITMQPCGSGERLVQKGKYGPPCNFTRIQKPHLMTWGMTDFPIYCAHEPVIEQVSIEQLGYPPQVSVPAEKVGDKGCTFCVYKNVDDVPEEFYTRVGKQKPTKK